MIEVLINQTPVKLVSPCTLTDALDAVVDNTAGMALALNGEIVRKPDWSQRALTNGDHIHVFRAVAGG